MKNGKKKNRTDGSQIGETAQATADISSND